MGTAINHAAAIKRLEALFNDVKLDQKPIQEILVELESKHDAKCDVHNKTNRRGSLGNILQATNRRDSIGNLASQKRDYHYLQPVMGTGVGPRRESMPALNASSAYYR